MTVTLSIDAAAVCAEVAMATAYASAKGVGGAQQGPPPTAYRADATLLHSYIDDVVGEVAAEFAAVVRGVDGATITLHGHRQLRCGCEDEANRGYRRLMVAGVLARWYAMAGDVARAEVHRGEARAAMEALRIAVWQRKGLRRPAGLAR